MAGAKRHRRGRGLFKIYMTFFAVIEIISLLAFGCVLFYFVNDTWEDEQTQNLFGYAEYIAEGYSEMLRSHDSGVVNSDITAAIASVSMAARADIFISDTSGNILYCRHSADDESGSTVCPYHGKIKIPGELLTGILAAGMMATKGDINGMLDTDCFVSSCVITSDHDSEPEGIVFALQTVETGLRPYHVRFFQIYILSSLVMFVVISLIIYVSTYTSTKPLREITEATKRYSEGDFSYRIKREDKKAITEFDELTAAVNSMADNLDQFEHMRTNFVANVSHELKTPMTTIGGFIDGILDGTIDSDHEEHYLRIVSDEVKRLSRLVSSMLNIAKIEDGELCIRPTRFNLTKQIIGIFVSFEQKIDNKEIHLKGLDHLLNFYIEADPDMINQVFYNLIDNAVKFTDIGGEIGVDVDSDDEFVYVSIRNTGKGIAGEDIDHIFERFYKGDKSRSLDTKSTGLGLFIVKNLVELHNGTITAGNIDDKYTEFTVKLKLRLIDV